MIIIVLLDFNVALVRGPVVVVEVAISEIRSLCMLRTIHKIAIKFLLEG